MEYIDGKPLTGLIPRQGMPPMKAVRSPFKSQMRSPRRTPRALFTAI